MPAVQPQANRSDQLLEYASLALIVLSTITIIVFTYLNTLASKEEKKEQHGTKETPTVVAETAPVPERDVKSSYANPKEKAERFNAMQQRELELQRR